MASGMLTGERRWVSARRGGMTVLGKVAVPKPVNLPSQRLENHGLDPNVEIVPKGTLSWGSRPSSSVPNAWGTSALSPHIDGSAGSPSRLNGRPSSGGSGTRPSTAGSDRSHDPATNAWGPNSRPSSASGTLSSNQTSVASPRPRSAETRPGSSQLSRFAEPMSENSGAWGGPGTAEKLGTASSKTNEFTLSSGDFPTLGSEKSSELPARQGHSSHGRPELASSGAATQQERSGISSNEDGFINASEEKGNVNTWKSDISPYHGGGTPPIMEKWQRDPQQAQPYPNPNMPPHAFDPWHGTPIRNPPDGVWYRGGPPGGPYGPPGPPSSYPLEPFGYYHSQLPARPMPNSQIPARPIPNSQMGPRPGSGPPSYHQKPGDTYHPRMPDSYNVPSHPVIPVRPGIYPAPVPYDGYYGPPRMGFCTPNERDVPAIGTAPSPVYNRYPNPNAHPDPTNFHVRPAGYSPSPTMTKEQLESGHGLDTHQAQYKVLLKQHDGWGENDAEEKRDHSVSTNGAPHSERGDLVRTPVGENGWEADSRKNEQLNFNKSAAGEEASSQPMDNQKGCSSVPATGNVLDDGTKVKSVDERLVKKLETAANLAEGPQQLPAIKKDAALIDKIEGLNTKARISDARNETGSLSAREEKAKRSRTVNVKDDHSFSESGSTYVSTEKASTCGIPSPSKDVAAGGKGLESPVGGGVVSRSMESQAASASMLDGSGIGTKAHSQIQTRVHGMQGRADYRGKGRFSVQDSEEWRKKSLGSESSSIVTGTKAAACLDVHAQHGHVEEAPGKQEPVPVVKVGGDPYGTSLLDSTDYEAQRAKMKELATQRAKQLQKEEEERTREQKAKALAKLEELNRRTLAENQTQKLEGNAAQHAQEEVQANAASPKANAGICGEAPGCASGLNFDAAIQPSDIKVLIESTKSSMNKIFEASPSCCPQDPMVTINSSLPSPQQASDTGVAAEPTTFQLPDNGASKPKQVSYKRKQNNLQEKNLLDKTTAIGAMNVQDNVIASTNGSSAELSRPTNSTANDDHPQQHKKKNNKVARSKHRPDESLPAAAVPSSEPTEGNATKTFAESSKPRSPQPAISVLAESSREVKVRDSQDGVMVSMEQGWMQPTEEAHGRVNNQLKLQPHRRVSKSIQSIRPAEKFHGNEGAIWAPVRSASKIETFEESGQNSNVESGHSSGKNGHGMQNSFKGKRAEMERYVAKPVAKELSQQENSQQLLSPSSQVTSDEGAVKVEYGSQRPKSSEPDHMLVGKVGHTIEAKNAEGKNRHGKTHASWRQRVPIDTIAVQSPHEGSSSASNTRKTLEKPIGQHQNSETDVHWQNEQTKFSDGHNMDSVPTGPVTAPVVAKDHGGVGKGRRQALRHRSTGHSHTPVDSKELDVEAVDKTDLQPQALNLNELDRRGNLRTEGQGISEQASSHWQPKSQMYSAHNRQGRGSGNGGQRVAAQGSKIDKELPRVSQQMDKDNSALVQPNQPETQKANATEVNSPHRQETKRERKGLDSSKEHANFPKQGADNPHEVASENQDVRHEQPVSMGIRRQGQHGGRLFKGQEAPYGGGRSGLGQQLPSNGDRRKHGSHYEYQPVLSYNRPNDSFHSEEVRDSSHATGSRYRERVQNHPRRGSHFYGRSSGGSAVRASAYGNGD